MKKYSIKRVRFIPIKTLSKCQNCKAKVNLGLKWDKRIVCKTCFHNPLGYRGNVFKEDIFNFHTRKNWIENNNQHRMGKSILKNTRSEAQAMKL